MRRISFRERRLTSLRPRHAPHPGACSRNIVAAAASVHALHYRGDLAPGRTAGGHARRHHSVAGIPALGAEPHRRASRHRTRMGQVVHHGVRRIRAEVDIAPGKPLPVLLQEWSPEDKARVERNQMTINALARLESLIWLDRAEPPESATALVGQMKILIPLAGLIDKHAELARLEKEIGKLRATLERGEAKLRNANFVERAPAQVVDKERARIAELRTSLAQLEAQAALISAL